MFDDSLISLGELGLLIGRLTKIPCSPTYLPYLTLHHSLYLTHIISPACPISKILLRTTYLCVSNRFASSVVSKLGLLQCL